METSTTQDTSPPKATADTSPIPSVSEATPYQEIVINMSPNETHTSATCLEAIQAYNTRYIKQVFDRLTRGEIDQEQATRQMERLLNTHEDNTRISNEKNDTTYARSRELSLLGLPREVRLQILRCLLLRPILGTYEAVKSQDGMAWGKSVKYGLVTNVLLVCRTLNTEELAFYMERILSIIGADATTGGKLAIA